jgi:porin
VRRRSRTGAILAGTITIGAGGALAQQPAQQPAPQPRPPETLWTQPALLDWQGGPRAALKERGLTIDAWITGFYQGIVAGRGNKQWQLGGKGDLIVTLDGGKAGLWRGFFVSVHQEWNFGRDINNAGDGSLLPLNTAMAFPREGGFNENTSVVVTQVFSEAFSLSAGKFNLLELAAGVPLTGGGGLDTFTNLGLAAPASGVTPPYLLGAVASWKTEPAHFTLMVYDPRNAQEQDVLDKPFDKGTTTSLAVTFPTKFGGLPGYYGLRGVYSSKNGSDLSYVPFNRLPAASGLSLTKKGYYYGSASFQQYLAVDPADQRRGWGVFGEVGLSDGNPNALKWHVIAGIGGSALWPGRELDRWGVAYFQYGFSPALERNLNAIGFPLRDERGVEAFYNFAVTPWLRVSANVQWVAPHRGDRPDATIASLRTQVRF